MLCIKLGCSKDFVVLLNPTQNKTILASPVNLLKIHNKEKGNRVKINKVVSEVMAS